MRKLTNPKIGDRVVRGPDWKWGDQDGNGPGTIVEDSILKGWVRVEWDHPYCRDSYRVGASGCYDLAYLNDAGFDSIVEKIRAL